MPHQSNPLTPHGHELSRLAEQLNASPDAAAFTEQLRKPGARINVQNLVELFRYHAPTDDQLPKYDKIRVAAYNFALVVLDNTPACADQSAAIRHIREAMMTANAAIATDGMC